MTERKKQKIQGNKVKIFTIPSALGVIKENISISTLEGSKYSLEKKIKKAINLHSQGNISEALNYYKSFIDSGLSDHRVFSNYGIILKDLGKLKEAKEIFLKAIKNKPNSAEAYSNLGSILKSLGQLQEAELSTRKAIKLNPSYAMAHCNLANILVNLGKVTEAELSTRKAIQLNPNLDIAYCNLGGILMSLGKIKEAELSTRKAIKLNPNMAAPYCNLGNILVTLGNLKEAELSARKAIKLNPNYSKAYANLGGILVRLGNLKEAEISTRKAIKLNPNYSKAYANLAKILSDLGKSLDANKNYSIALEMEPNNIQYYINSKLNISPIMNSNFQINDERKKYRASINKIKDNPNFSLAKHEIFNTDIFFLAYHNRLDDKNILEELSNAISQVKGVVFKGFSKKRYLDHSKKRDNLKLGICSEFFRANHTIGKLYTKVLIDLLKTDLEISIYVPPSIKDNSDLNLIKSSFKRVIDLPSSTYDASKLIFSDHLDILFYPDIGMSSYTYILSLSKLALVQVTSLGHPNTSGIKNIDYFISNDIVPHHPSSSYTENLIKFSRLPFNYPIPKINESKLTNIDLINSDKIFKIGLTQTLFKLHPDFDKVLVSILKEIKDSYLILIKDKDKYRTEELQNRWRKHNKLLIERSIFLDKMSNDDFINTTKSFQIMLDPFYFGSGNTYYEAMAFGIPFITYPYSQRGSLVASGYKQMGIRHPPIADSPEDYIKWCKKYAEDNIFLMKTKNELKKRAQKYLFNDKEIYKEYYTFFTKAVEKAREGKFINDNCNSFSERTENN